ncbi:hypothetical protein L6Q96_22460 [Candidatus Binatia bacterium]|nr:hypothetical protein [Candidatus Binatia bacterium]
MQLPGRDLAAAVAKHFRGTPAQRCAEAERLGEEALRLFLATQPPRTSRAQALATLRRNKHRGRQRSRVMDGRRA